MMPLKPVTGTLNWPLAAAQDIFAIFEQGLKLAHETSPSRKANAARDLNDTFYYIGAIYPSSVAALQPEFVRLNDLQLSVFAFTFETWLHLLHGASDECIDTLVHALQAKPNDWKRREMLAAIGTSPALTALTELSRKHDWREESALMGFEIPSANQPARPRFTGWRKAIQVIPFSGDRSEWLAQPHPIGVPLPAVADESCEPIIHWHYLSLAMAALQEMPSLDAERLHLVSPRLEGAWTLYCSLRPDGRYTRPSLVQEAEEAEDDQADLQELLAEREDAQAPERSVARLLPFDDNLTYCNGHILLTENVYGQVGGPPIGLYPNPECDGCGHLMFHILTVQAYIHEYGDGWRSLFVCEDCCRVACQATHWN